MKNNSSQTTDLSIRTLRIRIKDKHAKALKSMAFDVNQVCNYCNELSQPKSVQRVEHVAVRED